jgi:hypothetical protein
VYGSAGTIEDRFTGKVNIAKIGTTWRFLK